MTARILVVDDIPANVKLLEARLLAEYFEVATATNGEEALAICDGGSVDLVLLDIMMPGMDGLEVCAKLKASPDTADLPVIFLTGMEDEDAEEAALDAGAADFISKPIRPRILESRVRMQMQNYLYLQFLEKMLREKSTTVERLRAETASLLKSIGLTASK